MMHFITFSTSKTNKGNMVSRSVYFTCVFLLQSSASISAPNIDLITNLPGLEKLPEWKQYSGYLTASKTKHFHYWFVESQYKPESDPVVVWLNGGPGCSSLDGYLSENGPFHVKNEGETLYSNPWSWNKIANVLYIESPAGVGFSYDDQDNIVTGDSEVAENNYNALVDFYTKFPQFKKNKLFVTGESYAGVYVPTLSVLIMKRSKLQLNFQGMAVGNGLTSYELNDNSVVFFAYYHGLFGEVLWKDLTESCCENGNITRYTCHFHQQQNGDCADAVEEAMQWIMHSGLNSYSLYRDCYGAETGSGKRYNTDIRSLFRGTGREWRNKTFTRKTRARSEVGMSPPCINTTAARGWLNRPSVRSALHIPAHLPAWDVCNDKVNTQYRREHQTLAGEYAQLLSSMDNYFRVLVYNGDTDMACNFLGDEWFVDDMLGELDLVNARSAWYVDGQVAGFAKLLTHPTSSAQLTYTTIKGAGHMVPQWKPHLSYVMFQHFINNQTLI